MSGGAEPDWGAVCTMLLCMLRRSPAAVQPAGCYLEVHLCASQHCQDAWQAVAASQLQHPLALQPQ